MARVLNWIGNSGSTLIVAAIAFIIGMSVMLPTGVVLPDSAAALIGAVLGAIATIGGALLLWKVQERQRTMHLARSIAMQFGDVLHGTDDLLDQLEIADQHAGDAGLHDAVEEQIGKLERLAANLLRDIKKTRNKLDRFSQSFHLLASEQVGELMLAEAMVDTIQPITERVANWFITGAAPAAVYIPGAMTDAHRDLHSSYDDLGKTLECFAPGWSKE